jgi:hypothetical protein
VPDAFNVVHLLHPKIPIMMAYREVAETVHWGLKELGYMSTFSVNQFHPEHWNILFGGQSLKPEEITRIPQKSIFYNLEQIANTPIEDLSPTIRAIAARFRIWEYNAENIQLLRKLNPAFAPIHVPIAWGENLRRIEKQEEDIDVLFYGGPTKSRMNVFGSLAAAQLKCVFAAGLFGPSRDSLIARSKIVLNLNCLYLSRIFEIVRVSYLLANEKAVVSDIYPESLIETDIREGVAFAPLEKIVEECARLVADDGERSALALRGRVAFEKRDIRRILPHALAVAFHGTTVPGKE